MKQATNTATPEITVRTTSGWPILGGWFLGVAAVITLLALGPVPLKIVGAKSNNGEITTGKNGRLKMRRSKLMLNKRGDVVQILFCNGRDLRISRRIADYQKKVRSLVRRPTEDLV